MAGTVSLRFAYPFLAPIADGLGAGIAAMGFALACGEATGLLAPLIGPRLDRVGRRRGMVDGLVVGGAGCVVVALAPGVAVFGAGIFTVAVGRYLFDVSLGAWIGDAVPFERRGRATGVGELAWSGAFLGGVPVAGVVMTLSSWRVPYLLSAAVLLASVPVVRATLPPQAPTAPGGPGTPSSRARVTAVHLVIFATSLGAALLFVTQGAWFERDLGLSPRSISLVVGLLGVGEVVGALLAARFADRLGKRRTVAAGLVVLVPSAAAFALVGTDQIAGVGAAVIVGLAFELAFVSSLPLVVEVPEDRRAGALSLAVAALTTGRTVAALVGTAVFDASGMDLVVAVSVPSLVGALVLLGALVHEPVRAPAEATA